MHLVFSDTNYVTKLNLIFKQLHAKQDFEASFMLFFLILLIVELHIFMGL